MTDKTSKSKKDKIKVIYFLCRSENVLVELHQFTYLSVLFSSYKKLVTSINNLMN